MGTFTAQILIGKNHAYEGGILQISHSLLLSENGVARWTLGSYNPYQQYFSGESSPMVSWVPDPDTMLEDGLLLLGLFVWKDEQLLSLLRQEIGNTDADAGVLENHQLSSEFRAKLHNVNRSVLKDRKLVITVLNGSSIARQLDALQYYPCELEVCVPKFSRSWNVWSQSMDTSGSLAE